MAQGPMHKTTATQLGQESSEKVKDKGTKTSKVGANRPRGKSSC